MKIVVLAKQVPDTWSDRKISLETGMLDRDASDPVPDEINERALEAALQYKEAHSDSEVIVLSMGPQSATDSMRKLLSMGADSAVVVADDRLAGSDMRSEEHTSELQSRGHLVCRLLLEKKNIQD